jgi:hypothetical protein
MGVVPHRKKNVVGFIGIVTLIANKNRGCFVDILVGKILKTHTYIVDGRPCHVQNG